MSTQIEQTSIRTEIVVDAPIERAVRVFIQDFDRVKPREHNMLGVELAETVFEPRAGGLGDQGESGVSGDRSFGRVRRFGQSHHH